MSSDDPTGWRAGLSTLLGGSTDGSRGGETGTDGAPAEAATDASGTRLSTGLPRLDRHLDGGIPPGRIVTLVAPPDTQSELLLKHLAAEHDCLYVTTLRPRWEVQEEVADHVQSAGGEDGPSLDIVELADDAPLADLRERVESIESSTVLVVDAINELETIARPRYVRFVDDVKETLWDTRSAGVFYGLETPEPAEGRTVTLRRTDLIWRLRRAGTDRLGEYHLEVAKFRGGRALHEPVGLHLTDEVRVVAGPGRG